MSRLTDNDRHFGPLTFGRSGWHAWRVIFSTGGGIDGYPHNYLTWYLFGWTFRLALPTRMRPWRRWVATGHYQWATSPSDGYWSEYPREYGFSLSDGFLQVFLGAQTHDSETTKSWCARLPWTEWRFVRHTYYDTDGEHFLTEWDRRGFRMKWEARTAVVNACPSAVFEIEDYDGARIKVKTRIEEREWRFGEGWFKWLSWFRKPMIRRTLDLEFSAEVGPEKGSWKGGLMGTGTDINVGESPESAFRRYCDREHRDRSGAYRIKFIGPVEVQA